MEDRRVELINIYTREDFILSWEAIAEYAKHPASTLVDQNDCSPCSKFSPYKKSQCGKKKYIADFFVHRDKDLIIVKKTEVLR
ncbi:MAG: hypothetical protein GY853_13725 [PVC group bacterium]|nr:hypothetical protein [PVC group bacterium]